MRSDRLNLAFAAGVFSFALVLYTLTVQNTVPFWDSGEFIATSYVLGIPHPPGTPLYVLIGRLFTLVPVATIATRVNWLSSLASAFAVLFTYLVTYRLIGFMWKMETRSERLVGCVGAAVGALFMAFSTSFWDSAVEAEVYNISGMLMLLCVWMVLRWREAVERGPQEPGFVGGTADIPLVFVAYISFLAVGIHLGTILALPPLIVFALMVRWKSVLNTRFITLAIAFAVVGLSVHLYLLLRARLDPPINEADPSTWSALWEVLTRKQYAPGGLLTFLERKAPFWFQLNHMYIRYFLDQFRTGLPVHPALLPVALGVLGAVGQAFKDKKGFVLILGLYLITSLGLVVYLNFSQNEVRERDYFFIASYGIFCIWIGLGAAMLVKTAAFKGVGVKGRAPVPWWKVWAGPAELASRPAFVLACGIVFLLSMLPLVKGNQFYYHNRKGNFVARDYAYNMLAPLEKDAIIFTNGDNDTFPLWYLQEVEGIRKDVRVVNLSLLNTPWYIKQLKYQEPRVPISFTDAEIDALRAVRDRTGRIVLVKDFAVQNIIATNRWRRPLYLAVTVPDQMGLETRLVMEGLAFRINSQEGTGTTVDVEKTRRNLYEVFRFDGLLDETRSFTDKPYKDENTLNLIQNYCAAHVHVAYALRKQGKLVEAVRELEAAKAISPWYSGITTSLGELYEEMGAFERAESHYREMLGYHPDDPRVPYKLGVLYARMGRADAALEVLEEATARFPEVFYLLWAKCWVYREMGDVERAKELAEEWMRKHPGDEKAMELLKDFLEGRPAEHDTT